MKPLNYSLLNKKGVVIIIKRPPEKYRTCFAHPSRKLYADDTVNDYINSQIKKASEKLDKM